MKLHRIFRPLLLATAMLAFSASSFAGVFFSVTVAPPPLPVYEQPMCPGEGYIWTPGYWSWGDEGYYWVPGTWVMAPQPGFLWTPGYWGWSGGAYVFNAGYWGPHVGFYGGVNYGFGYGGRGYEGGEWRGRNFYYNRSVNNVNVTNVTNVYNKTVIVNNNTHVAYNGPGGVQARPNLQEQRFQHERHIDETQNQRQHMQEAGRNPQMFAKNNGGRPAIAATARPGDFKAATPARAAGGRVAPETLNANPKNMPARGNNANNGGARGGNNVPKPSSATTATRSNGSPNTTERNVPRPNNNAEATSGRNAPRPNNNAETTSGRNVPRPPSASNNARTATPSRDVQNRAQCTSNSQCATGPHGVKRA